MTDVQIKNLGPDAAHLEIDGRTVVLPAGHGWTVEVDP